MKTTRELMLENIRLRFEGARLSAEILFLRAKWFAHRIRLELLLLEHWLLTGELPRG